MSKTKSKSSEFSHSTIPTVTLAVLAFALLIAFMVTTVIIFRGDQGIIKSADIELGKNTHFQPPPPPPPPHFESTPFAAIDPGFLFIQNNSKTDSNALWMMQKSYSSPKNLNIKDVYKLFNSPQSNKAVYQIKNSQSIYVYDLSTSKTKEIKEVDSDFYTPVTSIYSQSISPNGKNIVYRVDYKSKTCDGNNICSVVDPYPNNKKGYYAYNLEKDIKVYLGEYFLTNNWSEDSRFVYISEGSNYHEFNLAGGSYKINVNDGMAQALSRNSTEYSSVTSYYIEEKDLNNVFAGTVGNAQTKASTKYIVNKGRIQATIDSQVFGDLSSNLSISPSRDRAFYTRKSVDTDGKVFYEFVLIDFNTLATKVIMQDKSGENLWKIGAFWYDDQNIVYYESNPFGSDSDKKKANLYRLNLMDSSISQITKDGYSRL